MACFKGDMAGRMNLISLSALDDFRVRAMTLSRQQLPKLAPQRNVFQYSQISQAFHDA